MIFTMQKKELYRICRQAAAAASENPAAAYINDIHISADEQKGAVICTGTNFETVIQAAGSATVEQSGSAVINKLLSPEIVQKMPEDTVSIETANNDNLVTYRSGKCVITIACLPGKGYPMPEVPKADTAISMSGIPTLVKRMKFAVQAKGDRPVYSGIKLDFAGNSLTATALNGTVMAETKLEIEGPVTRSVVVPAHALEQLARLTTDDSSFQVGMTNKEIIFWDGSFLFTSRLLEGEFMDTVSLFESASRDYVVVCPAEGLYRAVSTVNIGGNAIMRMHVGHDSLALENSVAMPNTKGLSQIELMAMQMQGSSSVRIPARISQRADRPFCFRAKHVAQALAAMTGDVALILAENRTMVIVSKEMRCLVIAVRDPAEKAATQRTAGPVKKVA